MSRLLGPGVATSTGLYARCGDGWRQLQPTRTPLGVALADLLASGVEPCPVCEKFACDCDEWHEIMNGIDAAERGELGDYESELPY
jgi:hypothetical protein